VKFGKLEHEYDERTVQIGPLIRPDIRAPSSFDFDKGRAEIPLNDWGSKQYRSDVLAAQANYILRRGRLVERRTLPVTTEDVIRRYKQMTGCNSAGDEKDTGLTALSAFRYWRKHGWDSDDYKIFAFGELDPLDPGMLRKAAFVFLGVFLGFWLPVAVQRTYKTWDYAGQTGYPWKAGSLGGVLAYAKAYDLNGFEILLWNKRIRVTNEFIAKYCDEAYAVISDFDTLTTQVVDIEKFQATLARQFAQREEEATDR
jgi:hypothetical protein